ncbi:hypothetical protein H312_00158 [Anncaliia algerae PRA339]|uniref:Uncharacterized protein n=2 Tax=Anncaliia algerae PRA339 TaxID=1288291 RepID=A0A059F5M6_9MICR|nr:hypothetical protein H312_00158 [Anncaliia algerae PRA339]
MFFNDSKNFFIEKSLKLLENLDLKNIVRDHEEKISIEPFHTKDNEVTYEFFNDIEYSIMKEYVQSHILTLNCDLFSIINDYVLVYVENDIIIYKWNEKMIFKKVKTVKSSLLQFLMKTNSISEETFIHLSKIFLYFIKNEVKRVDYLFEKFMCEININYIYELRIRNNNLICIYKNFVQYTFDNKLRIIGKEKFSFENLNEINEIEIKDDSFIINRMSNIQEKYMIPAVKYYFVVSKFIFLLSNKRIHVIEFKDATNK